MHIRPDVAVYFQLIFTQIDIMEAADQANLVLQLPRFKFEGRNQQEFRRNWPQIARHYGIQGVVDGTSQRPVLGDEGHIKMLTRILDRSESSAFKRNVNLLQKL